MKEIKVSVKLEVNGKAKTYQLTQTAEAVKNEKTGKQTLAHFQTAEGNQVVRGFSKLYIDTVALAEAIKEKEATTIEAAIK